MSEKRPPIPDGWRYMVSGHEFMLHGAGHHLRFEPGVVMAVPRALQPPALAHGARAVEGEAAVETDPEPPHMKDPGGEEYRAAVVAAAERLLTANRPEDFGANGKPYVSAWERELGWKPVEGVRDPVWDEVKDAATRGD